MADFPFLAAAEALADFELMPFLVTIAKGAGLLVLCFATNWIGRNVIVRVVRSIVKKTRTKRDDIFLESGALTRVSHLLPALVVHFTAPLLFSEEHVLSAIGSIVSIYLIFITLFVFDGILNAVHALLARTTRAQNLPVKGFIQATKLLANLVGLVFVVSVLFGKTPVYILSGLGALTAVLMLISAMRFSASSRESRFPSTIWSGPAIGSR